MMKDPCQLRPDTMNRRFVNLVVDKWRAARPAFDLHRIDPSTLFYPTGSPKPADPPAAIHGRLPSAAMSFDLPCERHQTGWMDFMAVKNKVVAVDHKGRTVLYDPASRSVLAANPMQPAVQSNRMFVTVGGSLYVVATEAAGLPSRLVWFFALIQGPPPDLFGQEDWYWRSLDLPPFYHVDDADHYSEADDRYSDADERYSDADRCSDADYTDDTGDGEPPPDPCAVSAFTVVGDSQIWVSTVGAGTYSFDTVSRRWSKVGEWALPFRGRAEYLPEHSLWFGFSPDEGYQLCAADLALTPPVQHKVASEDPPSPPEVTAARLLPLGSGKLCVSRLFQETEQEEGTTFVVVTGVEVRRAAGVGSLQMIKHRSRRYGFEEDDDVRLL